MKGCEGFIKNYLGYKKLFRYFGHQKLQSHLKTGANRWQIVFSWNTSSVSGMVCLILNSSLMTWLFLQIYQCSKFTVLCNSFLCTEPCMFSFLSLLFLFYWGVKREACSVHMLYINTCRLFFRIGLKCNIPRIIGEQLLQLIYFLLWYISIMKTNIFSYWQYITERFLVSGYESNTAEQWWSITVKFFRRRWSMLESRLSCWSWGVGRGKDSRSLELIRLE